MGRNNVEAVAAHLAQNPEVIGMNREYSFGPLVKNFVEEERSAIKPGWKIRNATTDDVIILIAAPNSIVGNLVDDSEAILDRLKADAIFAPGDIFTKGDNKVNVSSTSSKYRIDDFLRSIERNATRFPKWQLKSRKVSTGAPENTNFENSIESRWISPFQPVVEDSFTLRDTQNSLMQSTEFTEANFVKSTFQCVLSFEHFLLIQVNAGTELTITAQVGAHDSSAQRFIRNIRKADTLLMPYRG